jgi:hypothetical protein
MPPLASSLQVSNFPTQTDLPKHSHVALPLHSEGRGTQWTFGPPLNVSVMQTSAFASHFEQSSTALHCVAGTHPPQQLSSTSGTWPAGQLGVAFLQVTSLVSQSNIVQRPAEQLAIVVASPSAMHED